MTTRSEFTLDGGAGALAGVRWAGDEQRYIAVLVHGYGEHLGRYEWVADRLVANGAVVYGADHVGHGRSDGERVLIADFEPVVEDVRRVVEHARREHPSLPVVIIGHSMGGMIGARYLQRFGGDVVCAVLSGPVLGRWGVTELLDLDQIPPTPIDPATLSRDASVGAAYEADPLVWHGDFKRPTLQALATALRTINDGGTLGVPTLWLHGSDDHLVPIEDTRYGWEQIAGDTSHAKHYEGARHEIFNETNKDEVIADVLAFIDEHLPAR
ncbi:alpha/beta fold hydrolase [Janibacter sp. GXQ6167]|uniref:alpha/beta fold hydrolase n=1 Tax=Janibacter sp. GXQ6167 TaxID=3240791 RepID=UPI00352652E8